MRWTVAMYEQLLVADGAPSRLARTPGPARDRALRVLAGAFPNVAAARAALAELRVHRSKRRWTVPELEILVRDYPVTETSELAKRLRRSVRSVYAQAELRGLTKDPNYLAEYLRQGAKRLLEHGAATRFRLGHDRSPNKGVKGWDAGGRSHETRFKKGNRPWTWQPVGSEKLSKDGYLLRKVSDTGYPPRDWRPVHRLIWERANGRRVPRGHVVVFRDGDPKNLELENLELVSRRELMARNTIHNLPEDLKRAIHAVDRLRRAIRKRKADA